VQIGAGLDQAWVDRVDKVCGAHTIQRIAAVVQVEQIADNDFGPRRA
jgi:hypothetical protein